MNSVRTNNRSVFFFVLTLWIALSSQLHAEPFKWPDISTDEAKVKVLLYAEKLYPGLFEGMTAHDTDLLMTLSLQEGFLKKFSDDPKFKDFIKNAADRKKISIAIRKEEPVQQVVVDAAAFKKVGEDLNEGLKLVSPTGDFQSNLREGVVKQLVIRPGDTPDKAAGRLAESVPDKDRKTFYKLPIQEKLKFFDSYQSGDPSTDAAIKEKIAVVQELRQRDETLRKLVSIVALTAGQESLTHEKVAAQLQQLVPEEHARHFSDNDQIVQRVRELLKSSLPDSKTEFAESKSMQATPTIKDAMAVHTKALKSAQPPKPSAPLQEITLVEVPAWLAIFRGCVGGDCASKNLAAYANSPATRIFYVDTGKGTPGGYVESAEVMSNGKKYLNVSTINGTKLNADHTEAIIRGLHEASSKLGVEGIILVKENQLALNYNYAIMRDRVLQMIKGKSEVPMEFTDADLRRALKEGHFINSDNYHSPDKIKSGILYTPDAMPGKKMDVVVEAGKDPVMDEGPINRGRALLLSMELAHSTVKPQYTAIQLTNLGKLQEHVDYDFGARVGLIERILGAAKVPKEEFERLRGLLANTDHLSFDDAVSRVAEELKKYGYDLDPKFKTTSMTPFIPALLRSPDVFAGKQGKDRAVAGTLTLLEQGVEKDLVIATIKEHPELFKDNNRLKNTLVNAFKFEDTTQYYKAWALADKVGAAGLKLDGMPDVVKQLRSELTLDDYHKKAAVGALIKMRAHLDEAMPVLFDLAGGKKMDAELQVLFNEARATMSAETAHAMAKALDKANPKLVLGSTRLLQGAASASKECGDVIGGKLANADSPHEVVPLNIATK